jgi:hypothetical protein
MAVLPLNTFRTITRVLLVAPQEIYVCPTGVTGIVLLAQISNVGSGDASVTVSHMRQRTATELVKDYEIPPQDAATVLTGRLVLEEGDRLRVQSNTDGALKILLSLVESANT